MITPLDISSLIYAKLNGSSQLTTALTGGIYKTNRPANSDKEDIVINVITVNTEDAQRGVANVNIHVPPINVDSGTQPNELRLKELETIVTPLIANTVNPNNNYWIDSISLIKDPKADDWYLNYRLKTKYHNN